MKSYVKLLATMNETVSLMKHRRKYSIDIHQHSSESEANSQEAVFASRSYIFFNDLMRSNLNTILRISKSLVPKHTAYLNREERLLCVARLETLIRGLDDSRADDYQVAASQQLAFEEVVSLLEKDATQLIQQAGIRLAREEWAVEHKGEVSRDLVIVDWDLVRFTELTGEGGDEEKRFISRVKVSLAAAASRYGGILWKAMGDRNLYVFERRDGRDPYEHYGDAVKCAVEILSLVRAANKIQKIDSEEYILPIRIVLQSYDNYAYATDGEDGDDVDIEITKRILLANAPAIKDVENAILVSEDIYRNAILGRWRRGHVGLEPLLVSTRKIKDEGYATFKILADPSLGNLTQDKKTNPRYYRINVPGYEHVKTDED